MATPTWSQPQPAAPAPKKSGGCLKFGCLGVAVFVAIIAVTATVASKSSTGTAHSTITTSSASSQAPAAPANSAPAAAAAAAVILKTSGNGIKNTASFTTGDSWSIQYTYDCTAMGMQGNMQIYVDYPNGDIAANAMGSKGGDTSTETGAGTHTLKVNSECAWTVTVTNG